MWKKIEYILADPEGNRTILVVTPVSREDYQSTAQFLLEECPEAEQVGYIKDPLEKDGVKIPYMEMCGLEFCGNATRAFAYYEALRHEPPLEEITVCVSGAREPLKARIDEKEGRARLQMPIPYGMERISIPVGASDTSGASDTVTGQLVEMEGIAHLILTDVEPGEEIFRRLKDYVYDNVKDYPAFGVMFIDVASDIMTPVVYVRDVDTTYFEGSCASGTLAAAYAMTATCCVPVRTHTFRQPGGTLSVEVRIESGAISLMLLEGGVSLSDLRQTEINI